MTVIGRQKKSKTGQDQELCKMLLQTLKNSSKHSYYLITICGKGV